MPPMDRACLSEESVIAFYEGRLSADALAALELHIDACADCRTWLSELAGAFGPVSPSAATTPVQGAHPRGANFVPQQLIANRYRVIRFIAQGGMGEVYEVEDTELKERIALKTVRAVVADDQRAISRQRREVLLARRVTHENVCRIFDFGSELRGDPLTFLTMELLDGESLSERLKRGRLSVADALPIATQMAAALDAAHRVGVIHRDFKPSNVMLQPSLKRGGGARVVVTDFGLARDSNGTQTGSLSHADDIIGSPEYMSPEQVEAAAVGPAADVYAFGMVLYEMVTGHLPFTGSSSLNVAIKRLQEAPPSPKRYTRDLPTRWEQVILRCLEREPRRRFTAAGEAIAALQGTAITPPANWATAEHRSRTRHLKRWFALSALLAAIAVGVALTTLRLWQQRQTNRITSKSGDSLIAPRRSLAIVGCRDLSNDQQEGWLGAALGEMLTTDLATGEELRVISTESVAKMRRDLALPLQNHYEGAALEQIRKRLSTDFIVVGSYLPEGAHDSGKVRVDLTLEEVKTGQTLVVLSETGAQKELIDLVARLGARLRGHLGLPLHPQLERESVARAMPRSPQAAQLYVEGLVHQRNFDLDGGRQRLEQAVKLEPDFPMAHAALADIYRNIGLAQKAIDEANLAFTHAGQLSREERLAIEANYRLLKREYAASIDLWRALYTFFPDNLNYGLMLAKAQITAGESPEAVKTLEALRALPPPLGDDPQIDSREALAYAKQGDWKQRLFYAERAMEKLKAMGARTLLAINQRSAAEALYFLGDLDRAKALFSESMRTSEAVGDKLGAVEASTSLADILSTQGHYAEAKPIYEAALAFHRQTGDQFGIADKLNGLAQIEQALGHTDAAKQLYEQSLVGFRNCSEREGIGNVLSNYADLLMAEGDLDGAEARLLQARDLFHQVGMTAHEGSTYGELGTVELRRGHLATARKQFETAIAMLKRVGDREKESMCLSDFAELERQEHHPDAAQKHVAAALAIATERRDQRTIVKSTLVLAELLLDAHENQRAEAELRKILQLVGDDKELAARAQALLSRAAPP